VLTLKEKRKKALKYRSLFLYQQFLEDLALKTEQENNHQNLKKEHAKKLHLIHFERITQRERSYHHVQQRSNRP
jgi:hypothetical protein